MGGLCTPLPTTERVAPAPSSQLCGKRTGPFLNETKVQKDPLLPKLHSPCRSWDPISSLLCVLGKSLTLSESHFPPTYTHVTVLWVGQNGTRTWKTLRGALPAPGKRPHLLRGALLGPLPRRVGGSRPTPGLLPRCRRWCQPGGARDRDAHTEGPEDPYAHPEWRAPRYPHSPRAPRDSRAGKKSFMSGLLRRLRGTKGLPPALALHLFIQRLVTSRG